MPDSIDELRSKVALSCRILAMTGLVKEITGHVSARIPGTNEMFLRCRGDDEFGLPFTTETAVRRLDFDGNGPDLDAHHDKPFELPIHGELLRSRPDASAVVHAHPPAVVLCGLAGADLRPIVGCFDTEALVIAMDGIPMYPRSVLIDSPALGQDLVAAMGDHNVCLMRGHGLTTIGRTVEEATLRAIKVETLARLTWQLLQAGKTVPDISDADKDSFRQRDTRGSAMPRRYEWLWRYYVKLLEHAPPVPADLAIGAETM
jgi:ribulose-5-phosphate 4-epimerase/fuculose-1-phosphate aldolase